MNMTGEKTTYPVFELCLASDNSKFITSDLISVDGSSNAVREAI